MVLFIGSGYRKGYRRLSPVRGGRTSSNFNGSEAYRAIDGKIKTRWTSGQSQIPGMFFRVDLGRTEKIARLRLRLGDSYRDFPRRAEIRFSLDGLRWEKGVPLTIPVYWTGEKLFKDSAERRTWSSGKHRRVLSRSSKPDKIPSIIGPFTNWSFLPLNRGRGPQKIPLGPR